MLDEMCKLRVQSCLDSARDLYLHPPSSHGDSDADNRRHPASVFIPEDVVKAMEDYVDACRSHHRDTGPTVNDEEDDRFEGSLRVPTSVLHECNESFKAADEKRQKASTQFFADTGLMALLCRHDRVLWLVNMTSAGERQIYALALLKQLFDNLPPSLTVGALYDIGCQLHLSFEKWKFLPEYATRLTFGLAIFHAFGHQWPCQLIYHPRYATGFGLSDGEGCERFWNLIKKLIPTLRVSGVSVCSRSVEMCLIIFDSSISASSFSIHKFSISTASHCIILEIGCSASGITARPVTVPLTLNCWNWASPLMSCGSNGENKSRPKLSHCHVRSTLACDSSC